MEQTVIHADGGYKGLTEYLRNSGIRSVLFVSGSSVKKSAAGQCALRAVQEAGVRVTPFDGFSPNPEYASVTEGVKLFREMRCDAVFAIGGGSAMDVAKCIKLYSVMNGDGADGSFLTQEEKPCHTKLLVLPTTAGTGSEATRYAVIYYQGEKQSVTSDRMIPDVIIWDPDTLEYLPDYQKKAAMLDALCHGIESFWSVNSTEESKSYASEAIGLILKHMSGYLENSGRDNDGMMQAAYLAGKAINITQTTAGHAMSYKLTGIFGIAHGHAVALCVKELWPWMLANPERCVDKRGITYLNDMFSELARVFGKETPAEAVTYFGSIVDKMAFEALTPDENTIAKLTQSVNPVRLKNNPVLPDEDTIKALYHRIR